MPFFNNDNAKRDACGISSNISGNLIQKLAQVANDPLKEITTVIVKASPDEFDDPSVVKVATTFTNNNPKVSTNQKI